MRTVRSSIIEHAQAGRADGPGPRGVVRTGPSTNQCDCQCRHASCGRSREIAGDRGTAPRPNAAGRGVGGSNRREGSGTGRGWVATLAGDARWRASTWHRERARASTWHRERARASTWHRERGQPPRHVAALALEVPLGARLGGGLGGKLAGGGACDGGDG